MTKNILTFFNKELGYTTVSIQYSELLHRIALKEYLNNYNNIPIIDIAKKYGLSISTTSEDVNNRIIMNYIIQIHARVEQFLNDYKNLIGSATYRQVFNPDKDNKLHWTMNKALGSKKESFEWDYRICNYYSILRNNSVHHSDKGEEELKSAYYLIANYKDDKLMAPNYINRLCFDDQVLFARSARKLMHAIYNESNYDWKTIISQHRKSIEIIVKPCKPDRIKTKQKIENYLKNMYPIPQEGIEELSDFLS